MPPRLRVVAVTGAAPAPVHRVFLKRLLGDPSVELVGVVADVGAPARETLVGWATTVDTARALRWPARERLGTTAFERLALGLFAASHPRAAAPLPGDDAALERTRVVRARVEDLGSEPGLGAVRALHPHVLLLVGVSDVPAAVARIPVLGALALEGRLDVAGDTGWPSAATVSVRDLVRPSVTVGTSTILVDECDTLESLAMKADLVALSLFHDAVGALAQGRRRFTAPLLVPPAPAAPPRARLRRRLERRARRTMPLLRARASVASRGRVFAQYAALLPRLLLARRRLERAGRAPVCIFAYHAVGNQPVNHLCVPLQDFVRHVEFLRSYVPLVSLDEAVERVRAGKNDDLCAAITFDDGYAENAWAVEYLRQFDVPAAFFVSIGHVRDGSAFAHDTRRGYRGAAPMSEDDVRRLTAEGFVIGSHGIYHEDFGLLDALDADWVLAESRRLITESCGQSPEHFAFPHGHAVNIPRHAYEAALRHYRYVYSASGGYNFPSTTARHFRRLGVPADLLELARMLDGYVGLWGGLAGDAWAVSLHDRPPY